MRSTTSRVELKVVLFALVAAVLGCGQPTGSAKITASAPPSPTTAVIESPADEQVVAPLPDANEGAQAATETAVASEGNAAGAEVVVEAIAQTELTEGEAQEAEVQGERLAHPFPRQVETPEFSKQLVWLNTEPLTKADLKGKFVLFDFWTYCCINCIHILPELKKLEQTFPNNLVVIGVHSAKFQTEKDTDNIRNAVMRYEIEHPVINDADHSMWNAWGINSWPSIILIDPEGNAVWGRSGEFKAPQVEQIITTALPYYRQKKVLNEKPLTFALEAAKAAPTPLRFPGKILADEKGNRLFISDTNHNRIVITDLDGKFIEAIGSGEIGKNDGDFQTATFNKPQGTALAGETLYVADNENHMLRKVDLTAKRVQTIAGTGEQASNPFPGFQPGGPAVRKRWVGPPATTELTSPWALWVHQQDLFIAMAGSHQIWKMPLDESEIGPYAGSALEDIVDGALLPREPFTGGSSAFAQPSGLSSDGTWLFVADSEGSSVRKVPLKKGTLEVGTVVGSDHLARGQRLFAFGDKDGPKAVAKLQHCLDVDFLDGNIYVADTYNNKIKVVHAKTGETKTLAGTGKPGSGDSPAEFHEPEGLTHAKGKLYVADTNNHLIRTIDVATGKVNTLKLEGLEAPGKPAVAVQ
jgi:DNA-binding beta-propeller fold protein YncE